MPHSRAFLYLLPFLASVPHVCAAKSLSVNFTVSGTTGFNGVDPGSLNLTSGKLTGSLTVITVDGTYPCTVNAGSVDIRHSLNLTCTIGPAEMVTFSGTLTPRTGIGKGTFSETFFKETGNFTAAKPN